MKDVTRVGLLLALAAGTWTVSPAQAATFGHTEVNQSKFVAVAVPRQDDYYSLLLIEQQSGSKDCWKENGTSPTQVEPLLLNFDFSGICGRSTDSNGYSIRRGSQDLALQYRLSVQKRQDDVVLMAVPSAGQSGSSVEIGRTRGIAPGFLKIHLNSGWRLTKRTYEGKTLGHVYLTTDQSFEDLQVATKPSKSSSKSAKRSKSTKRSGRRFTRPVNIPISPPASKPIAAARPLRSGEVYRVIVKTRGVREQDQVRRLVPDAFRSSYEGRSVMQAGLFNDKKTAVRLRRKLRRENLDAFYVKEERAFTPAPVARPIPSTAVSSAGLLPVPSRRAPLGNASGNRRVARVLPPPPPAPTLLIGPRYRVVVDPRGSRDRRKIKQIVPDAFRSSYRGQSVIQVGSFPTQSAAEDRARLLERQGFDPILEKTQ